MTDRGHLLDHIYDGYQLESLITAVYEDSPYRFGTLYVRIPLEQLPRKYRRREKPSLPGLKSYMNYGIQTVMHPEKGALLLGAVPLGSHVTPKVLARSIGARFDELTWLESVIRERLECEDYWVDRPIVMGVGVVTGRRLEPHWRPDRVPAAAMLDRGALPDFARHVDALFDFYTTERARPVDAWAPRLIEELTDPAAGICSFLDEEYLIDGYIRCDRELDGLVRPAA
jgi:hypothetical protein